MSGSKVRTIQLTRGAIAFVDEEDYEFLVSFNWHLDSNGYAASKLRTRLNYRMHKILNNTPEGMDTDHINRNKLDNRKINLRSVTRSENARNGSGRRHYKYWLPKGITFDMSRNKFMIYRPTKRFSTLEAAMEAQNVR